MEMETFNFKCIKIYLTMVFELNNLDIKNRTIYIVADNTTSHIVITRGILSTWI
jgi:hypothetical protein